MAAKPKLTAEQRQRIAVSGAALIGYSGMPFPWD